MSTAGKLAWAFILFLGIVHWDFWYWSDKTLMFGFMPIGLLYQALISIGASLGWVMVIKFAWPTNVERWADAGGAADSDGNRREQEGS